MAQLGMARFAIVAGAVLSACSESSSEGASGERIGVGSALPSGAAGASASVAAGTAMEAAGGAGDGSLEGSEAIGVMGLGHGGAEEGTVEPAAPAGVADSGVPEDAPAPENAPPITPRWAFEHWAWEDNTNTRASTETLIQAYLDRGIPVGAVIVDSPWETHYNDLIWDTARYPAPQAMIAGFHAKGVKVVMWITAFVDTDVAEYQTVKRQGYAVNGGVDATWWKGVGAHVDITNQAAAAWWNEKLVRLLSDGVDGWKLDRGADYIGDPIATSAGSLSRTVFKQRLSADFYDTTTAANPNAIVMVRPFNAAQGGVGSDISKCSMGWVGDHDGGFAGIVTQKNDIYTSAQMGYGAPGVEVGGYMGAAPSKNSLIRYAQFGALTPLMENGGENGGLREHLPWTWDAATVDIYRYFATLHSELGPYNFSYGVEAHLTGQSIIREADQVRAQHLLGAQILTSVITTDVSAKAVTFPAGSSWIDYWNEDTVYAGGTTAQYSAPLDRYPIFIKAGAILPLDVKSPVTGHGDVTSTGKITLQIYPQAQSGFTFHRPTGEGVAYENVRVDVDASSGTVSVTGASAAPYRLRIKSLRAPTDVAGADAWSYEAATKTLIADKQGSTFTLTIAGLQGYP
jgi:alpha-glucosidase (family GH31 glycosyl hydrolase)